MWTSSAIPSPSTGLTRTHRGDLQAFDPGNRRKQSLRPIRRKYGAMAQPSMRSMTTDARDSRDRRGKYGASVDSMTRTFDGQRGAATGRESYPFVREYYPGTEAMVTTNASAYPSDRPKPERLPSFKPLDALPVRPQSVPTGLSMSSTSRTLFQPPDPESPNYRAGLTPGSLAPLAARQLAEARSSIVSRMKVAFDGQTTAQAAFSPTRQPMQRTRSCPPADAYSSLVIGRRRFDRVEYQTPSRADYVVHQPSPGWHQGGKARGTPRDAAAASWGVFPPDASSKARYGRAR